MQINWFGEASFGLRRRRLGDIVVSNMQMNNRLHLVAIIHMNYLSKRKNIYIYIYTYTYEVMISCVLDHTEHVNLFEKSWSPAFSFIEKWLKRVGHAEERRKIGCSKYKVSRQVRNEEKERPKDRERCSTKLREIQNEKERHTHSLPRLAKKLWNSLVILAQLI